MKDNHTLFLNGLRFCTTLEKIQELMKNMERLCHRSVVLSFHQAFPGTDLLQWINFNAVTAKQRVKLSLN